MTDSDSVASNAEAFALDRAHVFHSWSAQGSLNPLVFKSGAGSRLWDFEGKEYLDFSSQLVNTNIGHQHPKVVAAIQEQAAVQATLAPQHASLVRGQTAKVISEVAPPGHSKVFFTNGGADAAENAIRMARLHTGKSKVLSFYRSYHGNTGAAINATGDPRRWPNEFAHGHVHFFGPYLYRSSFWAADEQQECERALAHLEQVIQFEGREHGRGCADRDRGRDRRSAGAAAGLPRRRAGACATSTASSTSPTRSWPASGAPASGWRSTTGT
ncbi:MAG: aminotransferase class III-fold pyridoxal phosphate-dependent enzyme [Candidatus Nanopelagicales bacterium]